MSRELLFILCHALYYFLYNDGLASTPCQTISQQFVDDLTRDTA
jgi:hypothetical protein